MADYELHDLPKTLSEFNQNYWIYVDPDDGSGGGKMRASLFQGPTGSQGPTGATGAQGIQGPQGLTGQQGPAGPTGPAGSNGINGAPGDAGSDGADGRSFWGGVGVPSNDLGQNDDVYLNLSNGDLYQKADGTYGYVSNLTGPTGATGATGPKGPPGVVFQDSNPSRTDQVWVDTDADPEAEYSVMTTAGGTFTGDVNLQRVAAASNLIWKPASGTHAMIQFRDDADSAISRVLIFRRGGSGHLEVQQYNAAGAYERTAIKLDAATGQLQLTGATSVTVPAATAATHAAQVTAVDAATGRLAVGGVEMGDTGWRKIASWTAGVQDVADQVATLDTGAYTLSGDGFIAIRRIGQEVQWWCNGSFTPLNSIARFPFTINPSLPGFMTGPSFSAGLMVWGACMTQSGHVTQVQRQGFANDVRLRVSALSSLDGCVWGGQTSYEAWPATLPGVAV